MSCESCESVMAEDDADETTMDPAPLPREWEYRLATQDDLGAEGYKCAMPVRSGFGACNLD